MQHDNDPAYARLVECQQALASLSSDTPAATRALFRLFCALRHGSVELRMLEDAILQPDASGLGRLQLLLAVGELAQRNLAQGEQLVDLVARSRSFTLCEAAGALLDVQSERIADLMAVALARTDRPEWSDDAG
jgi:hypothetical protein